MTGMIYRTFFYLLRCQYKNIASGIRQGGEQFHVNENMANIHSDGILIRRRRVYLWAAHWRKTWPEQAKTRDLLCPGITLALQTQVTLSGRCWHTTMCACANKLPASEHTGEKKKTLMVTMEMDCGQGPLHKASWERRNQGMFLLECRWQSIAMALPIFSYHSTVLGRNTAPVPW